MEEFEPKIGSFLCRWCYEAGSHWNPKTKHPLNLYMARVMCSCKANELSVLKAFTAEVDGVLVGGCLPEESPYMKENLSASKGLEF